MSAYYNEIDAPTAAWLRELIKRNLIAPGDVDERSIVDVQPDDVRGYTQCHWFAGIGVWSYALRRAGWSDDRPVWTGSCPCQPFSAAGKRGGHQDDRHLWPTWFRLIRECRPVVAFGEQVASADGLAWLDVVSTDLEAAAYAVGAVDTCAAGVGAPHIRQRLFFVADAGLNGTRRHAGKLSGDEGQHAQRQAHGDHASVDRGAIGGMADADEVRRRGWTPAAGRQARNDVARGSDGMGRMGDASGARLPSRQSENVCGARGREEGRATVQSGAVNGFWSDAEWIPCIDGKARPVRPGSFPLVTGAPARVVRLRGYGNCINAEVAREFIEAYRDVRSG